MSIRSFLFLIVLPVLAGEKPIQYAESIGFFNDGVTGFVLAAGFLVREQVYQKQIYEKVSIDSLVKDGSGTVGAAFVYTPVQRLRAQMAQHNTLLGFLSLMMAYGHPQVPQHIAPFLRFRPRISRAGIIEQAVVPTVICNAVQDTLSEHFPNMSLETRNVLAFGASCIVPRAAVMLGASPKRVLLHTYLLYLSGECKNKYGMHRTLRPIAESFESATRMVPVIQAAGTLCITSEPGLLNVRTPLDSDGKTVNFEKELYHAVVPTIICTGLGLGIQVSINLIDSTSFGQAANHKLDNFLTPIVGDDNVDECKNVAKQLIIAGGTYIALNAIKKYTQ